MLVWMMKHVVLNVNDSRFHMSYVMSYHHDIFHQHVNFDEMKFYVVMVMLYQMVYVMVMMK